MLRRLAQQAHLWAKRARLKRALAAHHQAIVRQVCAFLCQGVRRPPLPTRLGVKRALAAHEAGKGLVATLLRQRSGFLERIERVSMVPRGGCAHLLSHEST